MLDRLSRMTQSLHSILCSANGITKSFSADKDSLDFYLVQDIVNFAGYYFGKVLGAIRMVISARDLLESDDPANRMMSYAQFCRGALQYAHCERTMIALDVINLGIQCFNHCSIQAKLNVVSHDETSHR